MAADGDQNTLSRDRELKTVREQKKFQGQKLRVFRPTRGSE